MTENQLNGGRAEVVIQTEVVNGSVNISGGGSGAGSDGRMRDVYREIYRLAKEAIDALSLLPPVSKEQMRALPKRTGGLQGELKAFEGDIMLFASEATARAYTGLTTAMIMVNIAVAIPSVVGVLDERSLAKLRVQQDHLRQRLKEFTEAVRSGQ